MYVPAEAGGETLYTKSEAALVGQTLHKILRTFSVALILLFSPITACQHHQVTLQTLGVNRMSSNFPDQPEQNQEVKASYCSDSALSPSAVSRRWLDSNG